MKRDKKLKKQAELRAAYEEALRASGGSEPKTPVGFGAALSDLDEEPEYDEADGEEAEPPKKGKSEAFNLPVVTKEQMRALKLSSQLKELIKDPTAFLDELLTKKFKERKETFRSLVAECSTAGLHEHAFALMKGRAQLLVSVVVNASDAQLALLQPLINYIIRFNKIDADHFIEGLEAAEFAQIGRLCEKVPDRTFVFDGKAWGISAKAVEHWDDTSPSTRFDIHAAIDYMINNGVPKRFNFGSTDWLMARIGQGLSKVSEHGVDAVKVNTFYINTAGAKVEEIQYHERKLTAYVMGKICGGTAADPVQNAEAIADLCTAVNCTLSTAPQNLRSLRKVCQYSVYPVEQAAGYLLLKVRMARRQNPTLKTGVHFVGPPFPITPENARWVINGIKKTFQRKGDRR